MFKSKIKLVLVTLVAPLLLPLTVHAAAISNQIATQEISSLALLSMGILGLLLGRRRIEKE